MRTFFALLLTCAFTCDSFTTYYSPTGQYSGSASTIGGYTFYRSSDGSFAGSAMTTGESQPPLPAPLEDEE